MPNKDKIDNFIGQYAFLSTYYPSQIKVGELTFPTVENAFQASKTLDPGIKRSLVTMEPAKARMHGSRLQVTQDWTNNRRQLMREFLKKKFENKELAEKLKATGNKEIIETHRKEVFWSRIKNANGLHIGKNTLGQLLMEIREELFLSNPKKKKKKEEVKPKPEPVVEETIEEPKEEIVVEEKKPEPVPPSPIEEPTTLRGRSRGRIEPNKAPDPRLKDMLKEVNE